MCTKKISLERTAKQKVKRQEQQKRTGAQSSNGDTDRGSDSKNWHCGALLTNLHTTHHCLLVLRSDFLPCQLHKSWDLILNLKFPSSSTLSATKVKIDQYSYTCTAINVLSFHSVPPQQTYCCLPGAMKVLHGRQFA